jgi:uncharacterized membrane protein YjjP (DUF1212 family)
MTEIGENVGSACLIKESDAVYIAMEMGEQMLNCGGEVGRVEDTINRICTAYGAKNVDVTVIMSLIVLSVDFGGEAITVTRRIVEGTSTNLARFSRLNDLSRRICRTVPSREEFEKDIAGIDRKTELKSLKYMIGSILAAAGFAVFFGGNLIDAIFSGVIALPMMLLLRLLSKAKLNAIVSKLTVSFIGGVLALLAGKLGMGCNVNMIMIGNIMNVIPGVALTISLRDLIGGDIMSGVFRLSAVIVDAVAIACGYALAILLMGGVV